MIARKSGQAVRSQRNRWSSMVKSRSGSPRLRASYSVDEVIGDWWPEPPARSKRTGGRQDS